MGGFTRLAATGGALGLGALLWGTLAERTHWTLRTVEVPILPAGSAPVRVLHLSDLHMAPWQRSKQAWVRSLAALKPDLVVNTGDNLGHIDGIAGIRAALEPFHGVPGVFVNGSNDYAAPIFKNPFKYFAGPSRRLREPTMLDTPALLTYFDELGWRDLNNTATALTAGGTRFRFVGVDDPHHEFDRLDEASAALASLDSSTEGELIVGVAHAPYRRVLNAMVELGADLLFAGHTHGGQVCVPGYGALVTNCDIPRTQVKGLSRWRARGREAHLHVSAGLGTSIYAPVRFACPPEATLLTLVPRD
ncbi:MAG TPA: metallophosphoesterase [Candidatus Lumbricidophila sp.]|nr:metallophosphoesterase [Candidatus Lumbricidophila sp.]